MNQLKEGSQFNAISHGSDGLVEMSGHLDRKVESGAEAISAALLPTVCSIRVVLAATFFCGSLVAANSGAAAGATCGCDILYD